MTAVHQVPVPPKALDLDGRFYPPGLNARQAGTAAGQYAAASHRAFRSYPWIPADLKALAHMSWEEFADIAINEEPGYLDEPEESWHAPFEEAFLAGYRQPVD